MRLTRHGNVALSDGTWDGEYYGTLTQEGAWRAPNRSAWWVKNVLMAIAEMGIRDFAAANGRNHGTCCYCGRKLKTEESTSVGYGPVCADKWGLPWRQA